MTGQFFYSHMQVIPAQGDKPAEIQNLEGSFALEMVLRTMKMGDGRMIVILRDGHEQANTYKNTTKSGKTEDIRVREWVQSEIVLIPKDADRFRSMFESEGDDYLAPISRVEGLPTPEQLEDIGVE